MHRSFFLLPYLLFAGAIERRALEDALRRGGCEAARGAQRKNLVRKERAAPSSPAAGEPATGERASRARTAPGGSECCFPIRRGLFLTILRCRGHRSAACGALSRPSPAGPWGRGGRTPVPAAASGSPAHNCPARGICAAGPAPPACNQNVS